MVNRRNISDKNITAPEVIAEIFNTLKDNPWFTHLCNLTEVMASTFRNVVQEILRKPKNETYLLSSLPPLLCPIMAPLYFSV